MNLTYHKTLFAIFHKADNEKAFQTQENEIYNHLACSKHKGVAVTEESSLDHQYPCQKKWYIAFYSSKYFLSILIKSGKTHQSSAKLTFRQYCSIKSDFILL